jgi:hypothetical protein
LEQIFLPCATLNGASGGTTCGFLFLLCRNGPGLHCCTCAGSTGEDRGGSDIIASGNNSLTVKLTDLTGTSSGTTVLVKFCGVVSETLIVDLDLFLHKPCNLHSLFDPTPSYFSSAAFVVRMAAICRALVSGT